KIHYNQLPSFYGLPNEDPLHFIREFYNVLQTFPLHGLNEDQLKMRCFLETLKDRAKAWFMTLAPDSLTTWEQVYSKFIGRYYPNQKTQELRSQIVSFAQQPNEPLHEAWELFKDLQRQCPHHNFSPALLMNNFYNSLHQNLQYMVDNAAGGDVGARTAEEMMEIFETMSANSSQKSSRGKKAMVNEVAPRQDMIALQIAELAEQMRILNARSVQPAQTMALETCGTCGIQGHRSQVCPSAFDQDFEEQYEDVNALQGYQNRLINDPFPHQQQPQRAPMGNMQAQGAGPSSSAQDDKLDRILQFMTNTEASIKRLETQIGQLATRVGNLEAESDKKILPSQPEQAKAIMVLRSGKVIDNNVKMPDADDTKPTDQPGDVIDDKEEGSKKPTEDSILHKSPNPYKPRIPFPCRLRDDKKEKQFRDLYDMLLKVNVNLPLLD
ncbi:Unknown protein, partial [Striga hermonthica]